MKLAAQGMSNGLTQRGLSGSGRPGKTKDGPLGFRFQFTDRQIFDDTLFGLLQAVVVVI
jgi:hypothetical protein